MPRNLKLFSWRKFRRAMNERAMVRQPRPTNASGNKVVMLTPRSERLPVATQAASSDSHEVAEPGALRDPQSDSAHHEVHGGAFAATRNRHLRPSRARPSPAGTPLKARESDQGENFPCPIIGKILPNRKSVSNSQFGSASQGSSLAYFSMARPTRHPLRAILADNFKLVLGRIAVLQLSEKVKERYPEAAVDTKTLNNLKTADEAPENKEGKGKGPTVAAIEAASLGLSTPAWQFLVEGLPETAEARAELAELVSAYIHARAPGRQTLMGIARSVSELTEATNQAEGTGARPSEQSRTRIRP